MMKNLFENDAIHLYFWHISLTSKMYAKMIIIKNKLKEDELLNYCDPRLQWIQFFSVICKYFCNILKNTNKLFDVLAYIAIKLLITEVFL